MLLELPAAAPVHAARLPLGSVQCVPFLSPTQAPPPPALHPRCLLPQSGSTTPTCTEKSDCAYPARWVAAPSSTPPSQLPTLPRTHPASARRTQLQRLFAQLQLGEQGAVHTTALTKSFGWDAAGGQAFVQHDVGECMAVLMAGLEFAGSGTPLAEYVSTAQTGRLQHFIHCTACGYESLNMEAFTTPVVHIKGAPSLQAALLSNVTPEVLEGGNAYACSGCGTKVKAYKGWHFLAEEEEGDGGSKLPRVLPLHLSRYEWNFNTMTRLKVTDSVPFPLVLDLAPACRKYLDGQHPADALPAVGVPEPPAKWGPFLYELVGVMMHVGGAHGGHYFAYIKDYQAGQQRSRAEGLEQARLASVARREARQATPQGTSEAADSASGPSKAGQNTPDAGKSEKTAPEPAAAGPGATEDAPAAQASATSQGAEDATEPVPVSSLEAGQFQYRWMKFNDSEVKELSMPELRRALGLASPSEQAEEAERVGADSAAAPKARGGAYDATTGAYMLFYRRMPPPQDVTPVTPITEPPRVTDADVPADLADELAAANVKYLELKEEWEWERKMRGMRVHVDIASVPDASGVSEASLLAPEEDAAEGQGAASGDGEPRRLPVFPIRLHESRDLTAATVRAAQAAGVWVREVQPGTYTLVRGEPVAAPETAGDFGQDDLGAVQSGVVAPALAHLPPAEVAALTSLARLRRYDPVKDIALAPLAMPGSAPPRLQEVDMPAHKPFILETRQTAQVEWPLWEEGGMPLRIAPVSQGADGSLTHHAALTVCVGPAPESGEKLPTVADLQRCVQQALLRSMPDGADWQGRCRFVVLRGEDVLVLGELAPPVGPVAAGEPTPATFHIPLQAPLSSAGVSHGTSRGSIARRVSLVPGDTVQVELLPAPWAAQVTLGQTGEATEDVGAPIGLGQVSVAVVEGGVEPSDVTGLVPDQVPAGSYFLSGLPPLPSPLVHLHENVVNTVTITFNALVPAGEDVPPDAAELSLDIDRRSTVRDLKAAILPMLREAAGEAELQEEHFKVRAYRGTHKPVAGSSITGAGQEWKDSQARLTYYGLMEGGRVVLERGRPLGLGEILWCVWLFVDGEQPPPPRKPGVKATLTKDPRFVKLGNVEMATDTAVPAAKALLHTRFADAPGMPPPSRMRLREVSKGTTVKLTGVHLDTATLAGISSRGLADGRLLVVQPAPEEGETFTQDDILLATRRWRPITGVLEPAVELSCSRDQTFKHLATRVLALAGCKQDGDSAPQVQWAKPFSYQLADARSALPSQKYWDAARLSGDLGIGKGSQPLPTRTVAGKPWRLKQGDVVAWVDEQEDEVAARLRLLHAAPEGKDATDFSTSMLQVGLEEACAAVGVDASAVDIGSLAPSDAALAALTYVAWPPAQGEHTVSGSGGTAASSAPGSRYRAPEAAFKIYTPDEIRAMEQEREAAAAAEAKARQEAINTLQAAAGQKKKVHNPTPAAPQDQTAPAEGTGASESSAAPEGDFSHPVFGKYLRLLSMGMPLNQVIMSLRASGVLGDTEADDETLESLLLSHASDAAQPGGAGEGEEAAK